jgi:hypothetical protein
MFLFVEVFEERNMKLLQQATEQVRDLLPGRNMLKSISLYN